MRLLNTIVGTEGRTAKVYRDTEWDEYIVRLFVKGPENKAAAYHSTYKDDAVNTAFTMVGLCVPN